MSDEFPRPYAEEPPVPESLSGLRLVRAHPWSVAATVVVTALLMTIHPLMLRAAIDSDAFYDDLVLLRRVLPLLAVLPTVVPLTAVALLARRRVTVLRVAALLVASVLVAMAVDAVYDLLPVSLTLGGGVWSWLVPAGYSVVTLLSLGLLAAVLYPAATRSDLRLLVLASVAVTMLYPFTILIDQPGSEPDPWTWVVAFGVDAVVGVAWAIAALVTSRPAAPAWVGTPAELGRQDP